MSVADALLNVTVNKPSVTEPPLFSDAFVVCAILAVELSSSASVTVAVRSDDVPLKLASPDEIELSVTITVSEPSTVVSSLTGTEIVPVVEPAVIVTEPLRAV